MKKSSGLRSKNFLLLCIGSLLMSATPAWSAVHVLQSRYDLSRTGANTQETILNTSNVNVKQFGQLFSYPVDGDVYAQPLYVSNLEIPGKGVHNVLFVVTMNDVAYAFDADSNNGPDGGLLWVRDFRNPEAEVTPVPVVSVATRRNIERNVGIESTPVIDLASQTLYLLARTKEKTAFVQSLHALDLTTGQDKSGSPAVIQGSYQGLTFDPRIHNQRAGLALAGGQIIITWAAHQDLGAYHGWVMAYDAASLAQTGVFSTTTSVVGGGIWASGRAPAVIDTPGEGQDIILFSGNAVGTLQGYDGTANFPESMLRLKVNPAFPGNSIRLVDWFTPENWQILDAKDNDLGGSGPVLLPGTGYIIGGGKEGIMYVVDPNNMGKMQAHNPGLIQSFRAVRWLHIMGGPVVWDRTAIGKPLTMYNWGESDSLKAYTFDGSKFDTQNVTASREMVKGHPGGILTLSANGTASGTGIVWSVASNAGPVTRTIQQGILRAYDAENVSHQLWNSRMDTGDDSLAFAKFTPPTVANGKVYVATFSNRVLAYGLLAQTRKQHEYVSLVSRNGEKALEVAGASRTPGIHVQINSVRGFARQRWEIKKLPNGSVQLISAVNQLFLDDARAGAANRTPVQVWTERTNKDRIAQQWKIVPTSNGFVKLISRENQKALTLSGSADGAVVWTEDQTGQRAQEWKIIEKSDAGITECNTSSVQMVSALPWGRVLTAGSGNTVVIDDWDTGSGERIWKITPRRNGGYEFASLANDLVLSAATDSPTTGAPLALAPRDPSAFQQEWKTIEASYPYETYGFVASLADGNLVTVENAVNKIGAPVVTAPDEEAPHQIWRIQDTNSIWCPY